ncbi:helix-turn-helix transcriptional regulator [Cohnella silvisoli]|uniref:YafY family protein n=1 Tax=Cohnella silvisoli TaxID=2873699 RepID=A0ABV1KZE1_9BACL|nr:YafY family protein [Cohnella silvisoli]MCD9024683.1 YafY family transcriptional regulator [Cohnella silvisoli]
MKIDRLLSIVMLLLDREKISASKLAEMFEVTPRTIFRDIETINKAGIPIITYPGAKGGIGIMEKFKLEKKLFTTTDVITLLLGLNSLNAIMSSEDLLKTRVKIKGLVSEEQILLFESKIVIDPTPWLGKQTQKLNFDDLRTSLINNRLLSFDYCDQFEELSQYKVEPYRLVLKDTLWYLHAYCLKLQGFKMFKLSSMSSVKLHDEQFSPKNLKSEPLDPSENKQIYLKLLIDESLRHYMAGYCGEENVTFHKNNKWLVKFPFVESDYGYGHLLSFGEKCICLEPEHVRLEVMNRINQLMKKYRNTVSLN